MFKIIILFLMLFIALSGCATPITPTTPSIKLDDSPIQSKEVSQQVLDKINIRSFSFIGSYNERENQVIVEGKVNPSGKYIIIRGIEGLQEYLIKDGSEFIKSDDVWVESDVPSQAKHMVEAIQSPSGEPSEAIVYEENDNKLLKTITETRDEHIIHRVINIINIHSLKPHRLNYFEIDDRVDETISSWVIYEIQEKNVQIPGE